jgi:adenylate cyclase
MIELERTFLVKKLPDGLENCPKREMTDIYYPKEDRHPTLRLRKDGGSYFLTKKSPVGEDKSVQKEQTITLTKEEFDALSKLEGKRLDKVRYHYDHKGLKAEIDVFKGALKGLVIVDFEFASEEDKQSFVMPDFCLAEVTHEEFLAGGMVCGKSYADIEQKLTELGYQRL